MTQDRWDIVERIFHDALVRPARVRKTYVRASCAADVELRREVESLLQADAGAKTNASLAAGVAADWLAEGRDALIGRSVGGYQIVSLLGAGGMGEVFLAEDSVGRRVALKMQPLALAANGTRQQRFIEETRAAASLNHPNVMGVLGAGTFQGRRYVITEFIEGETLRARMARGPLRVDDAVDIAAQTARALAAVHAAGIVHCDIKPENLMIRRDGVVKVLDFGLATRALSTTRPTPPADVMGTRTYMAPEQAAGGLVDGRADIYSLAVVLHEMVTGVRPVAGGSRGVAPAVRVPTSIERLLRRGLAIDPAARFRNAAALAHDLENLSVRPAALYK